MMHLLWHHKASVSNKMWEYILFKLKRHIDFMPMVKKNMGNLKQFG